MAGLDRYPINVCRKHESHIESLSLKVYEWCIQIKLQILVSEGLYFYKLQQEEKQILKQNAKKHLNSTKLFISYRKQVTNNL